MKSRRRFLADSSLLAAGGFALQSFSNNFSFLKGVAPSDQVNIGAIGINSQGWADTMSCIKNSRR